MLLDTILAVNWLGVVIGTVVYQVLGAVWYGPLFGSRWVAAMGVEDSSDVHDGGTPTMGYILTTVGSFIAVVTLAVVLQWAEATAWSDGLIIGLLAGIGFVATTGVQAVPFENRSWMVYFLNSGYNIVALGGAGVLLVLL